MKLKLDENLPAALAERLSLLGADRHAYRRDRRKDALLQEQGYFALRFLAEDVGKHLDAVLDTIMRALANRRRAHPCHASGPASS